jgi:hypothetical protein
MSNPFEDDGAYTTFSSMMRGNIPSGRPISPSRMTGTSSTTRILALLVLISPTETGPICGQIA